jgi:hypothetical protein
MLSALEAGMKMDATRRYPSISGYLMVDIGVLLGVGVPTILSYCRSRSHRHASSSSSSAAAMIFCVLARGKRDHVLCCVWRELREMAGASVPKGDSAVDSTQIPYTWHRSSFEQAKK